MSISDHDMVICVRKINYTKYKPIYKRMRNFARYDHQELVKELKSTDWHSVLHETDVNNAVTLFTNILNNVFDRHAPFVTRKVKGKPTPWLDESVKPHMDQRDKLLRKARKSNSPENWSAYKRLRNTCTNLLRSARRKYHQNLLNENRLNPKNFWKAIKKIFPSKKKTSPSSSESESNEKVSKFRDLFASVVNKLKKNSFKLVELVWRMPKAFRSRTNSRFHFTYVSVTFVRKELRTLKRTKATGLDQLPPSLLKDVADVISVPLTHIINLSLKSSTVPSLWKQAKIIPVFKSGNSADPLNYRPISVLPTLSKILEKAVHTQLIDYLEENRLLNNCQFGYRKNRSTESAATILVDHIRNEVDDKKLVGAVFMDLSRAFDTVSHSVLIEKLKSYGLNRGVVAWFGDYLFCRTQVVEVDTTLSTPFQLTSGVPQGSILGPLLFLIYFNDLADHLHHARILMYADDTVIYYSDNDIYAIENVLNSEFERVLCYMNDSELIMNLKIGKTESMLFGTSKKLSKVPKEFEVKYNNYTINVTDEYSYLGNIITPTLNLDRNFQERYRKMSNRIRLLTKICEYLTPEATYKVYDSMIEPLMLYCCSLNLDLTSTQQKKLTSIENRASALIGETVASIHNKMKIKCCLTVKRCMLNDVCTPLKSYFMINEHGINTRNKGLLLKLPKVRLEFGRKSFLFLGAKLYNSIPRNIREVETFNSFKNHIKMLEF